MKKEKWYLLPYWFWIVIFVILPFVFIVVQSFVNTSGQFSFENYQQMFSPEYLKMTFSSLFYASLITVFCLVISYPAAYILNNLKHKQLWLMLIIIPTWINMLLKVYAFIGILGTEGLFNAFLNLLHFSSQQWLFTAFSFVLVSVNIFIPFMLLPLINAIEKIDYSLVDASYDLGASHFQVFRKVIFPQTLGGIQAAVLTVFIPSLSLFVITRLIAGNKIVTLGTAIEQHYLVTNNRGMGATVAVTLIIFTLGLSMLFKYLEVREGVSK